VLLQEEEERKTKSPFGKPARVVMTRRATVRKQLGARFALIEILGMSHADQRSNGSDNEETPC
jgi:hypothetical protein